MFVPYSDLQIRLNDANNIVCISLPWIKVEAEAAPTTLDSIRDIIQGFPNNYKTIEFQEFISPLKGLSVGYQAPRKLTIGDNSLEYDAHYTQDQLNSDLQQDFPDIYTQIDNVFDTKILDLSYTGDVFDPITVFGLLKEHGLHKMADLENNVPVYTLLDDLRINNESQFFQTIEAVLNQTYFITSSFEQIIAEGIEKKSQPAFLNQFLIDLLKEEKGHNNLIKHSLLESGGQIKPDLIFSSSKVLMYLLQKAIDMSPLALALMMDILEGDGYPESDPLADLLAKSTRPISAKGLEQHFRINLEGNHKDTGINLAKQIPMLSKKDVEMASYIFKAAIAAVELTDKHIGQIITKYCQ